MAEHDPFSDLRELARIGEQYANPLPAARVRQLGQRRRTRRQVRFVAAVILAGVVAGGAVATALRTNQTPGPVTSPITTTSGTTTLTPSNVSPEPRQITDDNLIRLDDLPSDGAEKYEVARPGSGRALNEISVCMRGQSWRNLGASTRLAHSFVLVRTGLGDPPDPDLPLTGQPTTYTMALQFPDAAAAKRATEIVRSWVDWCAETLQSDPIYRPRDPKNWKAWWVPVKSVQVTSRRRAVAAFADVPTYHTLPDSENSFFESVGITQVADRLAVVVEIGYGQDYDVTSRQDDTEPGQPHPQFALLVAATKALTR